LATRVHVTGIFITKKRYRIDKLESEQTRKKYRNIEVKSSPGARCSIIVLETKGKNENRNEDMITPS
jgi:hypothetical protein